MPKQSKVYKDFYGGRCTGVEMAKLPDSFMADMFNTMIMPDGTIDVMYQLKTSTGLTKDISDYSADVDSNGGLYVFNHNRSILDDVITVSSISGSSVTEYNTASAHGLSTGDIVFHTGFTTSAHNGRKTITSTPTSTSYKTGDTDVTADSGYAYRLSNLDQGDGTELLFADSDNKIHLLDFTNNRVLKDFIDIGYSASADTGVTYYSANDTLYVSSFNVEPSISGARYKHLYIDNTICGEVTHDAWYTLEATTLQPEYTILTHYPNWGAGGSVSRLHDSIDAASTTTELISADLREHGIGATPSKTYYAYYTDGASDGFVTVTSQDTTSPYNLHTSTLAANWNTMTRYSILPPPGEGIGLNIHGSSLILNRPGTWVGGYYEFATTFVYVDGHESLPYKIKGGINKLLISDNDALEVNITMSLPYAVNIVGSRVYYRSSGTSDEWKLFIDVDFIKGYRLTTYDGYSGEWNKLGSSGNYDFMEIKSLDALDVTGMIPIYNPSPETYRSINGYPQDENSIDLYYNTVTTGEGRAWFGDVIVNNDSGNLVRYNDRLMFSPPGKYGIAPSSHYVDIVPSDGKAITALQYYEGKVLVFKGVNVYIIDVSHGSPTTWYIEQQFNCGGDNSIERSNIVVTDVGVVWACSTGCFVYSNGAISNLLYKRFSTESGSNATVNTQADWSTYVVAPACRVGYDRNNRQIVVAGTYLTGTSSGAVTYVYSVDTGTWSKGDTTYANPGASSTDKITNFVTTEDSLVTVYSNNNASDGIYLKTWEYDTLSKDRDAYFYTKMDDFGFPGKFKRIYGIAVKYKAGNWIWEADNIPNSLYYRTSGGAGSWHSLAFTLYNRDEYDYAVYEFSGIYILSAQTLQIAVKVTNPNTAYYYNVAEIKVIYRPILKRAPEA